MIDTRTDSLFPTAGTVQPGVNFFNVQGGYWSEQSVKLHYTVIFKILHCLITFHPCYSIV